jgi:cell division protein FtsA
MSKEVKSEINRRYLAEIIEARLEEIFGMINAEIKKINCYNKLAGGAVLVGGGAKMPGIVDFSKKYLRLPSKIGYPINLDYTETNEKIIDLIDDPSFVLATGLLYWGLNNVEKKVAIDSHKIPFLNKLKKFFKIFLP